MPNVLSADERSNTVALVRDRYLCHGCGMCEAVCRKGAVSIAYSDRYRTYVPIVDESLCNGCGLCMSVCSGLGVEFHDLSLKLFPSADSDPFIGSYRNCYLSWAKDSDIRFRSASGGVATALSLHLLDFGLVDHVILVLPSSKNKPLDFRGRLVRTRDDVLRAMGSKYCPTTLCGALTLVGEGSRVAVIGLPCQIAAIRKTQKHTKALRGIDLTLIGLFCSVTKGRKGTEWVIDKNGRKTGDLVSVTHRGDGWPGKLRVELSCGTALMESLGEYQDLKFHAYSPWRCKVCSDALSELADISIGDAWLNEILESDQIGTSIVIARSLKGEAILESAFSSSAIDIMSCSSEDVIRSQKRLLINKKIHIFGGFALSKLLSRGTPVFDNIDRNSASILSSMIYRAKREIVWFFARKFMTKRTLPVILFLKHLRRFKRGCV